MAVRWSVYRFRCCAQAPTGKYSRHTGVKTTFRIVNRSWHPKYAASEVGPSAKVPLDMHKAALLNVRVPGALGFRIFTV